MGIDIGYETDVDKGNDKADHAVADDADDSDKDDADIDNSDDVEDNLKESSPTSSFSAVSKQKPMKSARFVFH